MLSPVFAFLFVAMGLDMLVPPRDRGPWLYRERRISRGREFELLKFRTLRRDVLARESAPSRMRACTRRTRRTSRGPDVDS